MKMCLLDRVTTTVDDNTTGIGSRGIHYPIHHRNRKPRIRTTTMTRLTLLTLPCLLFASTCQAFVPSSSSWPHIHGHVQLHETSSDSMFEVTVAMPSKGSSAGLQANLKIAPVLDVPSEIVEVRYQVPFGLNVEPQKGLAVCTKQGAGGEKVGDILRYSSQWTLGLPQGDGIATQAAAFAGGLSWQCTMFNVLKAGSWEEVVEALVSNEQSRTDEVVLLFERPVEATAE